MQTYKVYCDVYPHGTTLLSNIIINIPRPLLAAHIFLLNQLIDVLLDIRDIECPAIPSLLNDLRHQLRMPDLLAGLHDAHDRGLDLELAVAFNGLVGIGLFLRRLLELDLVYFEAEERGCEGCVEGECVGWEDGFGFGGFEEDAGFS